MRIFGKILKIIFIFIFILSVCLNVTLFMSSTNRLIFKDSDDARVKLYYNSYNHLINSKNFTLETTYKYDENHKVTDKITCTLDEVAKSMDCTQVSILNNNEGELVRTSYFPGDGYKYSIQGEAKTKTAYSNQSLMMYASSLLSGISKQLGYLVAYVTNTSDKEFVSYKTSAKFAFNTFELCKTTSFKLDKGTSKLDIKYTFDGDDRLTKLVYGEENVMSIEYKKENLRIPSLTEFIEA